MGAEDRSAERGDLQGLTYGEVDLFSFLKILRSSEARDNQVFVDLVTSPSSSLSSPHSAPGMWCRQDTGRLCLVGNQVHALHR
jgi:hypothetical protein